MARCDTQANDMATPAKDGRTTGTSVSGRYNTPPLREDLVPRSRTAPERKRKKKEVKLSCFFDKRVKPTHLERSQSLKKRHDGGEQNLKHSVQKEKQGTWNT